MSQEQPAVIVKNLYKTFKLPHEQHSGIKQAVVNIFQGNRGYEIQKVLDDVSFEIKKGEFFGIVGRNGSGKSTLLKLLAGIYAPDKGLVQVNGSLTPFIELGVGFNHELTGRENVFMNGALLGFDRHEMAAMYDSIVDFAELHDFMDQKLKNYSSGMQVRLAFSIAIRAKTDILLIDEVLAVGDAAFQQKCFEFFMDIKKSGRTLILVTHDMSAVSRFCDKALFINNGVVESIGAPKEIADKYLQMSFDSAAGASVSNPNPGTSNNDLGEKIKAVSINSIKDGRPSIKTGSKCIIGFEYTNPERKQLNFGLQIFNESGNYCFGTNTTVDGLKPVDAKEGKVEVEAVMSLVPGQYSVTIAIMNGDGTSVLVYKPDSAAFRIAQSTQVEGVANLEYTWSMKSV